jgi:hypothetical protein
MSLRHELRYIDKAHAYCTCGLWYLILEDWAVCNDNQRMEMMEASFAAHLGMATNMTVTESVVAVGGEGE